MAATITTTTTTTNTTTTLSMTELADHYFATINPMAAKVKSDIAQVAGAYEHLWHRFSIAEQTDVINETLIRPDLVLRYFDRLRSTPTAPLVITAADDGNDSLPPLLGHLYDGKHMSTYAKQRTGLKRIQDDVCGVYRDEHSPPFAMKTKSQIALNLFERDGGAGADVTDTPLHAALVVVATAAAAATALPAIDGGGRGDQLPPQLPLGSLGVDPMRSLPNDESPDSSATSKPTSCYDLSNKDAEALPLLQFSKQLHQPVVIAAAARTPPVAKGNFLTKFITGNAVAGMTVVTGSAAAAGTAAKRPDDEHRLVGNMAATGGDDDDKQHFDEFNALLEHPDDLKQGYDFLNNW